MGEGEKEQWRMQELRQEDAGLLCMRKAHKILDHTCLIIGHAYCFVACKVQQIYRSIQLSTVSSYHFK